MRAHFLFASLFLVACGGSTSGTDGGADASSDAAADGRNPCEGLGCAIGEGKITLRVEDALSKAPVASVSFASGGMTISATCVEGDAGAGPDGGAGGCSAWRLSPLGFGPRTVTVTAPGYDDAKVTFDVRGPEGCCGMGPDVDETVSMIQSNPEARCLATGGAVQPGLCCASSPDFPDGCLVGACSCAPQNSVMIKQCVCPAQKCFDPKIGCK